MRLLLFALIGFFLKLTVPAVAETEMNYSQLPVYPRAKVYDLEKKLKVKMKMHLTDADFNKVTAYYLEKFTEKGWKVNFPDSLELKIWLEALASQKNQQPNIMFNLIKDNPRINCNITIGVVKNARSNKDFTIITLYLTDKFDQLLGE